ncbi:MAG: peptide-methionine (S)-S-oxide reductase [Verrucomicrobia bacterium]|nr:peptide-methionine (S)-S-oxide reductase [Verrucomicrobiota bacterium]
MKNTIVLIFVLLISSLQACEQSTANREPQVVINYDQKVKEGALSVAYFASGCFWCVEAIYQSLKGVKEAVSGYSGGQSENPRYENVSRGSTQHAEAVQVFYDPNQIDFETLVKVFFASHDPTTPNQQGPDRGPQYRSIAFYTNAMEMSIIESVVRDLEESSTYDAPIVTEIKEFQKFWEAEDYHQEYEQNHPNNPYVRNVSIPRLNRFKEKFPELLKDNH